MYGEGCKCSTDRRGRSGIRVGSVFLLITPLPSGQLRYVFVFILLDEHSHNFHERSERVRFILADFINEAVQDRDNSPILFTGMRHEYRAGQRRPRLSCLIYVEGLHHLFLPRSLIIFGVRQHGANINSFPIIVDGRDQANFIPADIEDGEFTHSVRRRKLSL